MRLIYKTAIPFVVVIFVIMAGIAYLSRISLERALIAQDFDRIKTVALNALSLETGDDHEEPESHIEEESHVEPTDIRVRTQILEVEDFLQPTSPESLDQFSRYIEEFKDPIVTGISLFTSDGRIIASRESSMVGQQVEAEGLRVFQGKEFYLTSERNGERVILSYVPFNFEGTVSGAVEVESHLSHVLGPVREEMNDLSFLLAVMGLLALLAFYLVERQVILKPIYYLRAQAERISAGKLDDPIYLDTKDELGTLGIFFDRMRESVRTALSSEQAKLKASIESLKFGFVIIDTEKRIILSNRAASEVLGANFNKPSFQDLENYFGSSFNVAESYDLAVNNQKAVMSSEIDTHNKFFKVLVSPVDSGGEVVGAIVVIEDTTEEILLARKKEEFFAVASHELRTPLTSIRGNMALIKDYYADKVGAPEVLTMVSQAHQSSIQLLQIVNEFLDASKLEQGKGLGELKKVNLEKVVREVVGELEILAKNKGIQIMITPTQDPLPVLGDELRLKEIVYNLIGNALNYTEKGEVRVEMVNESNSVKVLIKDTGVGILPQNQKLLFQKFQQAGESVLSRAISTSSTGMGLYISKLLVEAMHGDIGLLSSSKSGSVFFFSIPISK